MLAGKRGDRPVGTGFIVCSKVNSPDLDGVFEELGVPAADSDMSFAASIDGGRVECSLQTADTMSVQRRNLFSPGYLGVVRDIFRLGARAAEAANDPNLPLRELMARLGPGRVVRDWCIGPISGAIRPTPSQDVMDFPA